MLPSQLQIQSFATYPPQAQVIATKHLALLQRMPIIFVAILLRELIEYDWRFPMERQELDDQLSYLNMSTESELNRTLAEFASIQLIEDLARLNWVNSPSVFVERLTAHLWATHQMDQFRAAADNYAKNWRAAKPEAVPATPRLAIVVVGKGVTTTDYQPFQKLRPHGVLFTGVNRDAGLATLLDAVQARAQGEPVEFGHWYIDGAEFATTQGNGITRISYAELAALRTAILTRMQHIIESGNAGPEELRTVLAGMKLQDLGIPATGQSAVLRKFQISLLTEGSGTQIFSTTFAQWAAREALRRAQPSTLLVRFAPRQRQQAMNEMLSGTHDATVLDAEGSLVDADMGAYYTWLNMQRLAGADKSRFVAWFEGHDVAVAIGPTLPRGTVSTAATDLKHILEWV